MADRTHQVPVNEVRGGAPGRLLAITLAAVFGTEFVIMAVLAVLPPMGSLAEALLDASMLSLLVFPVLYVTAFRPLLREVEERCRAERALKGAYGELDARVNARTAELAEANEALRREQNFVDCVVETAGALVVVLDPEGRIVRFNKACERTSGYAFGDVRNLLLFPLLIPPDEVEEVTANFHRLKAGDFPSEFENHWVARNGTLHLITWANTAITGPDGTIEFVIGTGLDVTDNRLAQEALRASEERNRTILHTAQDGFWLVDMEGRFLDVNDAYCRLSGYSRAELLEMSIQDLESEESHEAVAEHISRIRSKRHDRFETRHRTKDGRLVDVEVNVSFIPSEGGQLFTFVRDITESKANERLIRTSLQEKEVLLKEIHHRVKNNLQVIASLLNLQAGRMTEDHAIGPLLESQNRIRTMALIHEKVYQSPDLARIPFADYVRDLADSLLTSFGPRQPALAVDVDVDDLALGLDTAIPVALIINELVSNSVKHAFDRSSAGRISISLRPTDPVRYLLVVTDNGRGLPLDLEARRAGSLGLQLVEVLATQLGGSVAVSNDGGARVEISFGDG